MIYGQFYNGIVQSEFDNGGFHSLIGVDIHSKPGTVTCSKSMSNADSGSLVTATPTCSVTIPDGNSFFAAGTKIYKVTSAGTVTLVHTNTQGAVLGMDYVCDGTADDVQIQEALDYLEAAGGGKLIIRSGTYLSVSTITSSIPMTWANGDKLSINFVYEAA